MIKTGADVKVVRITDHLIKNEQEAARERKDIFSSFYSFESNFVSSYMRGMATLQIFEELPCEEPDCPEVRKHLHFCLHAHAQRHKPVNGKQVKKKKHSLIRIMFASSLLQDEQSDSGMVLPSEELKHLMWNNGTKNRKLSRW